MDKKMKIVYIATSVIPAYKANAKQVMKMCQAFKQSDIDLELIIPVRFGGVRLKADPFDYYHILEKFKITKIFSIDLIPLEKIIGHLGFWLQNISFAVFTAVYLLFKKYDLVYTRDRFSLLILICFGLKKKLVWEEHNFPKKISWFHKLLFKKIKKIIVITNGLKEDFIKAGVLSGNILVAPDGVDLKEFKVLESQEECQKKLNLPLDKKLAVYTGHLFPWKGVYTLALSSKFLPEETEIILVGGMPEDIKALNKFIDDNQLKGIKVLGHQLPEMIPYYLKAADVLVMPNSGKEIISKKYTSPLKMFEYLAANKPLVASDLPSLREVLNEKTAVLVKPDDPEALASGIKKILADNELARDLASNSLASVEPHTWLNRVKKILAFINN